MTSQHISSHDLASIYRKAHNMMRNTDGLQPQEAFDELLKYLFFKQTSEELGQSIKAPFTLKINGSFSKDEEIIILKIKSLFKKYLESNTIWSTQIWTDKQFHLSDSALLSIHGLFETIDFSNISFDIRSQALKEFLPSEIRRGLGIYLTPDDVVKMMVDVASPPIGSLVYDIAVGSGTFLIEVLIRWSKQKKTKTNEVWGTDKNPRMLLLADLNLGHLNNCKPHLKLMDSLFDPRLEEKNAEWPIPNSFDYIFTNPPFGVVLDNKNYNFLKYKTCQYLSGETLKRQQSEIVFLEQSLKMLKPGGVLAIVLPKSVVTNTTLNDARKTINELGYIFAVVSLPPETFQVTGTQTTTVIIFMRKFKKNENRSEKINVSYVNVTNIGYDSTGRYREGNQLPDVANDIKKCLNNGNDFGLCKLFTEVEKENTLTILPRLISGKSLLDDSKHRKLGELIEIALIGRTPPRSNYSDHGLFVVKVGNLTNSGINWVARDRNYVNEKESTYRNNVFKNLMLKKGDILLTSSAHSPKYIAKKVDIIWKIPAWVGGKSSFVGEVMLLRPKPEIDPFILLAYLRCEKVTNEIQRMITGQTAHLSPKDLMELPIPDKLLHPDNKLKLLADNFKKEVEINELMNNLIYDRDKLLNQF